MQNINQFKPMLFNGSDRVCFIGDSITHNGYYMKYIYDYYITRFPEKKIVMRNCGIAGDNTSDVLIRMETDILKNNPGKATLMTGMNDIGRDLYSIDLKTGETINERKRLIREYRNNVERLVKQLRDRNIEVFMITATPYDQTVDISEKNYFGCNDALGECSLIVEGIAKQFGCALIDFYNPLNLINHEEQKKDPSFTIIGQDRIHPGNTGHLIMAYLFLSQQGAPAKVASLSIDAGNGTITQSENCTISNLNKSKYSVFFDYQPHALPMPVDEVYHQVDRMVPFTETLNKQIIAIAGLENGLYMLEMDGVNMGTYSSSEFNAGVNIALLKSSPFQRHAMALRDINQSRYELEQKLRTIGFVEKPLRADKIERDADEIKIFLNEQVETQKGYPWYDYFREETEKYFILKSQENEIFEGLEKMEHAMYSQNKPGTCRIVVRLKA